MLRIIKTSKTPADCPSEVPLSIVRPHEAQALKNHGQILDHLNESGGLSIIELYSILSDQPYDHTITERAAVDFVKTRVVNKDEAAEISYTQMAMGSEKEIAAYIRKLERRNQKYMGITIGIIIGFFLWMIYIFGWVV